MEEEIKYETVEPTPTVRLDFATQTSSPTIGELAKALSKFQSELAQPKLNKEVKAGAYKFKYADLANCYAAAKPIIGKYGLSVTHITTPTHLLTILLHESGEWLKSELPLNTAQAYQQLGSAITYLKRYSYCAILGICADDDDDANMAQGTGVITGPIAPKANLAQVTAAVKAAKTTAQLTAIWKDNTALQSDSKFKEMFSQRRHEIEDGI